MTVFLSYILCNLCSYITCPPTFMSYGRFGTSIGEREWTITSPLIISRIERASGYQLVCWRGVGVATPFLRWGSIHSQSQPLPRQPTDWRQGVGLPRGHHDPEHGFMSFHASSGFYIPLLSIYKLSNTEREVVGNYTELPSPWASPRVRHSMLLIV